MIFERVGNLTRTMLLVEWVVFLDVATQGIRRQIKECIWRRGFHVCTLQALVSDFLFFCSCCRHLSLRRIGKRWRQTLFEATLSDTPLPSLSTELKLRTADNAYQIQALFFEKLMKQNDDSIVGFKAWG